MKRVILLILFFLSSFLVGHVIAQPPPGGGPSNGKPPDHAAPITGIEWLLLAGAGFGAKKFYDKRKKS